jgi:hypothetical protein
MQMLSFVAFGHSHVVALAKGYYALQQRRANTPESSRTGRFHYLYDPSFVPALTGGPERFALNSAILSKLAEGNPRVVLLSIGGNEHNILSIVQNYQRYDFIIGENPDLPIEPDAEIYPEAVIRETLRESMADSLALLQALRAATKAPMAQIEPPPPLPIEHVLAYPKEFFRKAVDRSKLSSDCLRHKMWRVQSGIYRELCERIGIIYISVPSAMLDRRGTLIQAAWGCDATHANEWFGQCMVEEALRRLSDQVSA